MSTLHLAWDRALETRNADLFVRNGKNTREIGVILKRPEAEISARMGQAHKVWKNWVGVSKMTRDESRTALQQAGT